TEALASRGGRCGAEGEAVRALRRPYGPGRAGNEVPSRKRPSRSSRRPATPQFTERIKTIPASQRTLHMCRLDEQVARGTPYTLRCPISLPQSRFLRRKQASARVVWVAVRRGRP